MSEEAVGVLSSVCGCDTTAGPVVVLLQLKGESVVVAAAAGVGGASMVGRFFGGRPRLRGTGVACILVGWLVG